MEKSKRRWKGKEEASDRDEEDIARQKEQWLNSSVWEWVNVFLNNHYITWPIRHPGNNHYSLTYRALFISADSMSTSRSIDEHTPWLQLLLVVWTRFSHSVTTAGGNFGLFFFLIIFLGKLVARKTNLGRDEKGGRKEQVSSEWRKEDFKSQT